MSLLYELIVQEDLDNGTDSGVSVTNPDGGALSGTQIGIHSFAVGQASFATAWDPGAIAAGSYEAASISVPGAVVGDFVMASLSTMVTNAMTITGHVSAADTVKVVLHNPTAGSINLSSGDLTVLVFKARSEA